MARRGVTRYILIVIFGAVSYGMLTSFAKLAYGYGFNPAEISFGQTLCGAVVLWTIVVFRKFKNAGFGKVFDWRLVLAGTTMGLTSYIYYLSVSYIDASLAIVLLMQMTWMSILLEWIFFKKKPSKREIKVVLITLSGTVLASNLLFANEIHFSAAGILLALGAALCFSLFVMATTRIGKQTPIYEKSALMATGAVAAVFLINLNSIVSSPNLNFDLLKWGLFMGMFGIIIPPVAFSYGMPKIGVGLSAILLTLELPAAVLSAHILLGERISLLQVAGILVMLGAIAWLNLPKLKGNKQATIPGNRTP